MIIRVNCPNPSCKKLLRLDAKHAGRKIECTGCHQRIRLPSAEELKLPVAAATTSGSDGAPAEEQEVEFDLLASEAVLEEKAAADTVAKETMIDFTCPLCDEPVQLAAEHSGKRAPCPSCRRIIPVPKVDLGQPRDWREKVAQGPSLAKKTEEKLEGAWGNVEIARASQEALEEAKAIPRERRKLTVRDWMRYGTYAAMLLGVLAVIWWWLGSNRIGNTERAAVSGALAGITDSSAPHELRAVLQRSLGEYYLRNPDSDDKRREGISLLREVAATASDPLWVWTLSMDLARIYGQNISLDPKQTAPQIDPQMFQRLVSQVPAEEPREAVVRILARAVLEQAKGDPEKLDVARNLLTTVIRNAIPAGRVPGPPGADGKQGPARLDYSEQLSCLGVIAQELIRVEARDKALDVVGRTKDLGARPVYQNGMPVPRSFVAAMTMLAIPDFEVDKAYSGDFELGKMVGFFRSNQDAAGGNIMKTRQTSGYAETNLLPFLEVAEHEIEAGRQQEALVRLSEAMKIAEIYTDNRESNWKHRVYAHVRLCELTARAGQPVLAVERVQKLKLDATPHAGTLARALIAIHRPADSDAKTLLAGIPEKSAAQALAAFHLARQQADSARTVTPSVTSNLPDGSVQAAAKLGALLGFKAARK